MLFLGRYVLVFFFIFLWTFPLSFYLFCLLSLYIFIILSFYLFSFLLSFYLLSFNFYILSFIFYILSFIFYISISSYLNLLSFTFFYLLPSSFIFFCLPLSIFIIHLLSFSRCGRRPIIWVDSAVSPILWIFSILHSDCVKNRTNILLHLKIWKGITHICHFFSTYSIFGSIFLHTKAHKSRQNRFCNETA